jgi:hypothetical protein
LRKFFCREQRRRQNGQQPRRATTRAGHTGHTTTTTKTTKDANQPSKIQPSLEKDNKNVSGRRNQRDKYQMAAECEKKRDRIAKSDMQYREKQQRMMENIGTEILAGQQGSTTSNTTTPTSSQTTSQASSQSTSPIMSREMSPSPTRKISRHKRVNKNLQDISESMQQTGQVFTAVGSALFKSMKPDRKYR